MVISLSLIIWTNITIFSCWLGNRYWMQRPLGRMLTFMIWSNMATFCRGWTKQFWIKKTNKSWKYIYLYSSFDPTWLHFVVDGPIGPDYKKRQNHNKSPWAGFELTTLMVIGTDCYYHTIVILKPQHIHVYTLKFMIALNISFFIWKWHIIPCWILQI